MRAPARAGHRAAGRPLAGRRVLVTRPRGQAARLVALLEAYGAEVIAHPVIAIRPPEDPTVLDAALDRLGRFAWVVFTSANGVAALRERLQATGRDPSELSGVRLAAIGSETGAALRRLGLVPSAVPVEFRAEGLVETLRSHVGPDSEVLLVRAAEARDVLPRELAALGARVTIVPAYRTEIETEGAERVRDLLARRRLDVVTFTSSSTVRGLLALLPAGEIARLLGAVVLAAIGPVTAATLAESGLHARIVPREYTTPALADAIAAFFASAARRGVVG